MSYSEVNIKDGRLNKLSTFSANTVMVGLSVTLVASTDAERRRLDLYNKGGSNIWIGATPTMTAGATGINLTPITAGSYLSIDNYIGNVYAIVSPGVSGNQQPLGLGQFT